MDQLARGKRLRCATSKSAAHAVSQASPYYFWRALLDPHGSPDPGKFLHATHSWIWSRCEGLRRCCLVKAAQATVMMRMISADYVAAPCARVGKLEAGSAAMHHLGDVIAAWW